MKVWVGMSLKFHYLHYVSVSLPSCCTSLYFLNICFSQDYDYLLNTVDSDQECQSTRKENIDGALIPWITKLLFCFLLLQECTTETNTMHKTATGLFHIDNSKAQPAGATTVPGGTWWSPVVPCGSWWFLVISSCSWLYLLAPAGYWCFLVVPGGGTRWLLVVPSCT